MANNIYHNGLVDAMHKLPQLTLQIDHMTHMLIFIVVRAILCGVWRVSNPQCHTVWL